MCCSFEKLFHNSDQNTYDYLSSDSTAAEIAYGSGPLSYPPAKVL